MNAESQTHERFCEVCSFAVVIRTRVQHILRIDAYH